MNSEYNETRNKIINCFKKIVKGPLYGNEEILQDHPLDIYSTAIIFPVEYSPPNDDEIKFSSVSDQLPEDEETVGESLVEDSTVEILNDSVLLEEKGDDKNFTRASLLRQSSFGVSFQISNESDFQCTISYDTYTKKEKSIDGNQSNYRNYEYICKKHVGSPIKINSISFNQPVQTFKPGNSFIEIKIKKYKKDKMSVFTVFFNNRAEIQSGKTRKDVTILPFILFRPQIKVELLNGRFLPIKSELKSCFSSDKQDIMLYRNEFYYSKGHNCASRIQEDKNSIIAEFIPDIIIRDLNPELEKRNPEVEQLFAIENLIQMEKSEVIAGLITFSKMYKDWINELEIVEGYENEFTNNQEKAEQALSRINKGIELLRDSDDIYKVWIDANKAVANQFFKLKKQKFIYRPFQLGFFLLLINSIINPQSNDREFADLLWVATGGGKTEAYLAVTAFTILYRLSKYKGNGQGVAVISRYTLRLLTSQQFERSATLICALELIRRNDENYYGENEISLGLLIGRAATPNKVDDALSLIKKCPGIEKNPFPVKRCPWCQKKLYNNSTDEAFIKRRQFVVRCLNPDCEFNEKIPLYFIDENIYRKSPNMIISTVDKLAMIPFKAEEYKRLFFGTKRNPVRPPDLIIQDELHLIDGALGSIFGIYETCLHNILESVPDSFKIKIISSTATPKKADNQIRLLFNRKCVIFPPPGTDITDSFFTRLINKTDGREYIGILPSGIPAKTAARDISSALLAATAYIEAEKKYQEKMSKHKTKYTIIDYEFSEASLYKMITCYFNSIRELGGFSAMIDDDIEKRVPFLLKLLNKNVETEKQLYHKRTRESKELTGRLKGDALSFLLDRLSVGDLPDILMSTNMISVGIDIDRMNIMMVNGQPKKTAEYIQATSRTGRKYPGIVITLYNPCRIRDISHYEFFYPYHKCMYKHVEPVTVTPFSLPVLRRAYHAQAVSLLRILAENKADNKVEIKNLNTCNPDFLNEFNQSILNKIKSAEVEYLNDYDIDFVKKWLQEIKSEFISDFHKHLQAANYSDKELRYSLISDKYHEGKYLYLIKLYNEICHEEAKETMSSMRSVAGECDVKIVNYFDEEEN